MIRAPVKIKFSGMQPGETPTVEFEYVVDDEDIELWLENLFANGGRVIGKTIESDGLTVVKVQFR